MHRNSAKVITDGNAAIWLGANFWSRSGGPLMWRNYDPQLVRDELRVLRDNGLRMTRTFFYWPDFMPAPGQINEQMTARFADFLDGHAEMGMATIPTFLVGHMSGENWDPAWRCGRDLYGDVWMVGQQAWFAREMVRRFHAHPAVCGWLLSNEIPLYGGRGPRQAIATWVQIMIDAIRAAGGRQPVSTGDGAWGIEVTGVDNGFSLADIARQCDFVGPHIYPAEDDVTKAHYAAAWACELAGTYGRPVVLEEFGASSALVADAYIARYYRQVLHNTLLAGATGWVAWNNTDFDLVHQDPYRHHGFELLFGLTDIRGMPKPQLGQMHGFSRLLDQVGAARCERADSDAALVIPSYLDTVYPFTQEGDRTSLATTLRQAYIAARLADMPPALARESQGISDGARLYLVPSTKQLLGPTWAELERMAAAGATVYLSYSRGSHAVHRGPWHTHLNAMFGVEHQLSYGPADTVTDSEVTFTLTTDFGTLGQGARLSFQVAGDAHCRGYLPVRPRGAEVVAVDGHGRPALLQHQTGHGSVILCTYPVEQMAAAASPARTEAISALYDALASHAGVRRAVTVADPRIGADVLVRDDGQCFAWLVSQAGEAVTAKPQLAGGTCLRELDGTPIGDTVSLDPYDVAVFALGEAAGPA